MKLLLKNLLTVLLIFTIPSNLQAANNQPTPQPAQVRLSNQLCQQENVFITERSAVTKKTIAALCNIDDDDGWQVPIIALCASGGGMRAMISTLGSIAGMEVNTSSQNPPLNLFDCCTYFSALSGSTWAAAGLYTLQLPVNEYIKFLGTQMDLKDFIRDIDVPKIIAALQKKEALGQPVSFIDIYGCLLAQQIFDDSNGSSPLDFTLDLFTVANAQLPLPINNCIVGLDDTSFYPWIEFTPYEVGSADLQSYILKCTFGQQFNNGISKGKLPCSPLSFTMGLWGSAMSINAREFFDLVIDPELETITWQNLNEKFDSEIANAHQLLQTIYQDITSKMNIAQKEQFKTDIIQSLLGYRISPAQVHNWCYGLENSQLKNMQNIQLVDAGIDVNLGFAPLLRPERNVNIIMVADFTSDVAPGAELKLAEAFARQRNLKFPTIDYTKVNEICSVHGDINDATTPIIIYMPLVKNADYQDGWDPFGQSYTQTLNFIYTPTQIDQLSGLTAYNMTQSQQLIIDTIKSWIEARG